MREIEANSGVFISGETVLLPERNQNRLYYPGAKDLTGGNILPGESPLETLRRDAAEKLNISDVTVLAQTEVMVQEDDTLIKRHVFICRGNYDKLAVNPKSYSRADWFKKGEIPTDYLTLHALTVLKVLGYI